MNQERKVKNILPKAEPVFLHGNDTGFLFIHGFTSSPFEGRAICEWVHANYGFTVSAPLLPGHGTEPKDLINIKWMDWFNSVREKYSELESVCTRTIVCGQSMGGALALKTAAYFQIAGLITLAGAAFLKDWRLKFLPVARHIFTYQYKSKGPDICDKEVKPLIPSYSKYPIRSIEEVLKLLQETRRDLPKINCPALLIHSKKDRTVHFGNLDYIYDRISSEKKEKVVLSKSYHLISLDVEKDIIYKKINYFIDDVLQLK
jgi:carboxylesterase